MKLILTGVMAAILFVTGCATSSHIITGNTRTAISPNAVKIYAVMPPNAEIIGLVNAENVNRYKQQGMDSVAEKIKEEAAAIGANGVVVTDQGNDVRRGSKIAGTAIYVP